MLNRRIIRIKVFKLLFSSVHSQKVDQAAAEKELMVSFEKTRQLYFLLLNLSVALVRYAEERIEIGLNKYHPTEEEAHPNRRLADNRAIGLLQQDAQLQRAHEQGLHWAEQRSYVKKLYEQLKEEPYFIAYMENPEAPDFKADLKWLMDFYGAQLAEDPDLNGILEDMSLYWTDDVAFVCNTIITQLENLKETGAGLKHPDLFYNEEDKRYAFDLLTHTLMHYDRYVGYIEQFAENWDKERVAVTDSVLIVMGVAEAVAFPEIPVKVTLNEMVEISKFYSTGNSRIFVNGMLDTIIKHLTREGQIVKKGRGLIDN
ncbi:MAG: transcription antitermination protein NusB [Bacteroidales bacterium]|jgi:N utilization substance protein B